MKTFHLTWEPNPCGTPAESYSVYFLKAVRPRSGNNIQTLTAEEVVSEGVLLASKIKDPEYIHTTVGLGNTYAVVAHNGAASSVAKVVAANLDANVEI